ncbi:MAG: hypothetical protein ACP5R2_11915 [Anaerolineae bacterium]
MSAVGSSKVEGKGDQVIWPRVIAHSAELILLYHTIGQQLPQLSARTGEWRTAANAVGDPHALIVPLWYCSAVLALLQLG